MESKWLPFSSHDLILEDNEITWEKSKKLEQKKKWAGMSWMKMNKKDMNNKSKTSALKDHEG